MDIFKELDYKQLINNLIKSRPNNGRGEFKRIAEYLGVSSVLISQIFKGEKYISIEQGHKLAGYFGFIEIEQKFLLNLISYSRAGTFELKKFYEKELNEIRKKSKLIVNRVKHQNILGEKEKAIFYSDWKYSAIRLACDLDEIKTNKDLSLKFKLDETIIKKHTDFLIENGLIYVESGVFKLGPSSTHISKDSAFVTGHHRNWRLKSIETSDQLDEKEILYTAPMCVSKEVFNKLNENLLHFIDQFVSDASSSKGEELYYLNIDLRKLVKS